MKILPIVLVILAVATAIPAWFVSERRETPPELQDQYFGIELDIDDEAEVKSLADQVGKVRIVTWESDIPREILVERADGQWVIRTRYDYPADGETRLGETAGQVIGVRKLREVTSDEIYHQELGVLDPLDETLAAEDGRGQRATLWSDQGEAVVDLIIGGPVEGQPGQRYAREAGSPTVYTAEISGSLSSRFVDWVQPNPFDLEADQVTSVVVEDYSIDEVKGAVQMRAQTAFERADQDTDWTSQQLPAGQEVDQSVVKQVVNRAADLRLANVARRMGLGQQELMARGIFTSQDGQVYGNEGVLRLGTDQGYTYHLFFGEVVGSSTAGDDDGSSAADRILATWVSYDPEVDIALPAIPETPQDPGAEADEAAKQTFEEAQQAQVERAAERKQHLAEREQTVERLNARYQGYFYIIRDSDFKAMRPGVEKLFTDVEAETDE